MTELERQLAGALRELSAQYEREQRRQAESVEGLQRQVRDLQERVKDLVADYSNLASAYSELARDYRRIADALPGL